LRLFDLIPTVRHSIQEVTMRLVSRYLLVLAAIVSAVLVAGCAACQSCQGQTASAQAPKPPRVADLPPLPPIPKPSQFATPPTDEADTPEASDADATDPTPAPVIPPSVKPARPIKKTGRIRTAKTRDVEGEALVIEQTGNGTIMVNSEGTSPAPGVASAPAQMVMPVSYVQPQAYPLIPGPLPDAQAIGLAKRVGGSLWYLVTGKCPTPKASAVAPAATGGFATAPVSMMQMALPVQHMAYVPVQHMAAPMQAVYQPSAAPAPAQAPAPTVIYMQAPAPSNDPAQAPAPVFATPQAPRKSLFHRNK
jgi:hypothetical protein